MTTAKFLPIVTSLLLTGAVLAVPNMAQATEAQAAPLAPVVAHPSQLRCFMGLTVTNAPVARNEFHRGWFCIQESSPTLTH